MYRTWAIIERELRRFRRSPTLIIISMVFPLVQLVILGYAFGGTVKHLKVGVVDQDHGVPAVKVRELANAVVGGAQTFDTIEYHDQGSALTDLRNGRLSGVLTIPPEFSRKALAKEEPRIALIEDNTDNFASATLAATLGGLVSAYNQPAANTKRLGGDAELDVVEVYPYVPYLQYLLPGSITMSIFMMVMIGGGIIFIDDKARGLHEGYLVTPITKFELIAGFNLSGTIKAVLAGCVLMTIGSLIAGIPDPFQPMRLFRLLVVIIVTAFALISLMFLLMVRVTDPLVPRAIFGVLNTVLYFPSGAVYPQQGFPRWMQMIAVVDPFTYAVHAFKSLLLKNTGFGAITGDLLYLALFSVIAMTAATALFQAHSVNEDLETRQRLLEAAARLFSLRGLHDVTVREICTAAHANGAAVNYHFHDKLGLYTAVVRAAIEVMRGTSDLAMQAGAGESAEQKLRIYIRVFLERVAANGRDSWIHQLITREMSEPTPAFDLIIKHAIRPRLEYLIGVVSDLLGSAPDDERVMKCIASIQSQFLFCLNPGVSRVYPKFDLRPPSTDELAEHIAEFSLAGIRAVSLHPSAAPAAVRRGRRRGQAS